MIMTRKVRIWYGTPRHGIDHALDHSSILFRVISCPSDELCYACLVLLMFLNQYITDVVKLF